MTRYNSPSAGPDVYTVLALAGIVAVVIALAYLMLKGNTIFGFYPLFGSPAN